MKVNNRRDDTTRTLVEAGTEGTAYDRFPALDGPLLSGSEASTSLDSFWNFDI